MTGRAVQRAMRPALLLLICGFLAPACSGSEAPPADKPQATPIKSLTFEVFPFVHQLDDAALDALTTSGSDGTLTFAGAPVPLDGIERGSILLGGTSKKAPFGLLRIVRDVERSGSEVVVRSVNAPPQLAFRSLHVRASAGVGSLTDPSTDWDFPDLSPRKAGSGSGNEPFDFYLFDGDHDISTTDDQVRVHGAFGGGISYDVGIDTDWGKLDALAKVAECAEHVLTLGASGNCDLPEITAFLYVTPEAHASVMFEGAAFQSYEKEHSVGTIWLDPKVISIPPVAFTVSVDIIAKMEGAASSRFAVGTSANVSATTGLDFGTMSGVKFKPPVPTYDFKADSTDVTLSGSAMVSVGPRLSFKLYGLAGPYAGLYASAALDADQRRTPCYDLQAGLTADVGFLLTVPGLGTLVDVGEDFPILSESLETGSCTQPPRSSENPPGGGPDAEHFLNPTVEPWAKMVDSPVKWIPHQSRDLGWLDLSRAIDGNWVLAGWGTDALTKLDTQGDVVWSYRYLGPSPSSPGGDPEPYLLQRTLPTRDAGLLVVGHPYSLLKVGQGGGVLWATRFVDEGKIQETGPNGWLADQRTFLGAASAADGGFYVAGSHQDVDATPAEAWLLRLDANGSIAWSRRFGHDTHLYPVAAAALDDGVFLAGLGWDADANERRLWLARVKGDGTLAWAKRIGGCTGIGYQDMQPFDARILRNGDVLVSGVIDLGRRSFVMEVTPSGTIQWATTQWGEDTLTDLAVHTVRELPTTGFLAAGRYRYQFEQERLFLAGLDAKGRTQWLKAYGQPSTEAGIPASQSFPTMQLTDEGAALMAGHTSAPEPSKDHNLWLLQVRARDGAIDFAPGAGEAMDHPHASLDCPFDEEAMSLTGQDFDVAPESFAPVVEPVTLTVTSQTP